MDDLDATELQLQGAFYQRDGDGFRSGVSTRGPWSRDHQHGGPPAALMARALETRLQEVAPGAQVARLTVEFLRPIPIAPLAVDCDVDRAGRQVQVLSARLRCGDQVVATSRALGIRSAAPGPPEPAGPPAAPPPGPESATPYTFPFFQGELGYHTAMETRIARGTFGSGAMAVWMRMRVPLVEGEEPSWLQRVAVAADSGNGVSAALDTSRYTFVNPDLTVALSRPLEGPWLLLDAVTAAQPGGVGLADTALSDRRGLFGRGLQTLVVAIRNP